MTTESSSYGKILDSTLNALDILAVTSLTLIPGLFLAATASIIVVLILLVGRRKSRFGILDYFSYTFVLTFVAFIIGYSSANTRETVIGDIVPILLGGFGALLIFSYIQKQVKASHAALAGVLFSTSLFYGLVAGGANESCLLYTSPSPRDKRQSRMPSSA